MIRFTAVFVKSGPAGKFIGICDKNIILFVEIHCIDTSNVKGKDAAQEYEEVVQ